MQSTQLHYHWWWCRRPPLHFSFSVGSPKPTVLLNNVILDWLTVYLTIRQIVCGMGPGLLNLILSLSVDIGKCHLSDIGENVTLSSLYLLYKPSTLTLTKSVDIAKCHLSDIGENVIIV
jgi:hypothetical protein